MNFFSNSFFRCLKKWTEIKIAYLVCMWEGGIEIRTTRHGKFLSIFFNPAFLPGMVSNGWIIYIIYNVTNSTINYILKIIEISHIHINCQMLLSNSLRYANSKIDEATTNGSTAFKAEPKLTFTVWVFIAFQRHLVHK